MHPATFISNPYNLGMSAYPRTVGGLRRALAGGSSSPSELAERALTHANANPGRNTYLWQNAVWTRAEAARAEAVPRGSVGPFGDGRSALVGPSHFRKRLFRPRRSTHNQRRAILWRIERQRHPGFLARAATARGWRGHHRQNSPAPAGLRNHRRESRIRRLPAAAATRPRSLADRPLARQPACRKALP
jgi:hypothetical protein